MALKERWEGTDWIRLPQNTKRREIVYKMRKISSLAENLLIDSQEGLCSMELVN